MSADTRAGVPFEDLSGSGTGRLPIPPLDGSAGALGGAVRGSVPQGSPSGDSATTTGPVGPQQALSDAEALALIHTDPAEWVRQGEERAVNAWRAAHRLPPIVDESCEDCSWVNVMSLGSVLPIQRVLDEPCRRHDRSKETDHG